MKKYISVLVAFSVFSGAVHGDQTTDLLIEGVGVEVSLVDGAQSTLVGLEFNKNIKNSTCERKNFLFLDVSDPVQEAVLAQAMVAKAKRLKVIVKDDGLCGDHFNGRSAGRIVLFKG